MTYGSAIAAAAGTGGVKYDGDILTNGGDHTSISSIGTSVNSSAGRITMPDTGAGATADAIQSKLASTRAGFQAAADNLAKIAKAAQDAGPIISAGKSDDPAVKSALQTSSSVYNSVSGQNITGDTPVTGGGGDKGTDEKDKGSGGKGTDDKGTGGKGTDTKQGSPSSPKTTTSADENKPSSQQQGGGQPQQQAQAQPASAQQGQGGGQPQQGGGQGQGGGGQQQPGGMPMNASPKTNTGSPISKDELNKIIAEERAKASGNGGSGKPIPRGISPTTDPSGSNASPVATPVPVGNPSVNGGAVDPSQTSGRTASTTTSGAPGAGVKPAGSTMPMGGGMMGGMGAMGQGMGQQAPPSNNGGAPRIKRDRDSEAVLDGTAARDKALIGSILTDEDLISTDGEGDDDELLADQRNDGPRRSEEPEEDERW